MRQREPSALARTASMAVTASMRSLWTDGHRAGWGRPRGVAATSSDPLPADALIELDETDVSDLRATDDGAPILLDGDRVSNTSDRHDQRSPRPSS